MRKFLSAAIRRAAFLIWRDSVRAAFERQDPCTLFGLDLVIAPGVLHPRHFASSRLLAQMVMDRDLEGRRVADIGTGSGLLALLAARKGARVTAVDIDPVAVECAKRNTARNGLAEVVTVLASDVFTALPPQERFDLVVTNPPFYPRDPKAPADLPFLAGAGLEFFATLSHELPRRISRHGSVLLVRSSDVDFAPVRALFLKADFVGRALRLKRGLFETLTVEEFKRSAE